MLKAELTILEEDIDQQLKEDGIELTSTQFNELMDELDEFMNDDLIDNVWTFIRQWVRINDKIHKKSK